MPTKEKRKRGRPPKARQQHIPGMEPPSFPEIDALAEDYVQARDDRMDALKQETALHDQLLALLHDHGLRTYEYAGQVITVNNHEKVSVKRKKEETNGEADG